MYKYIFSIFRTRYLSTIKYARLNFLNQKLLFLIRLYFFFFLQKSKRKSIDNSESERFLSHDTIKSDVSIEDMRQNFHNVRYLEYLFFGLFFDVLLLR